MTTDWQNWSGSQKHAALELAFPESELAVADLIQRAAGAGRNVRGIGSAHSFVPFWTDDYLVSLDNMAGLISHDAAARQVTVWAGTKLHQLGEPLWNLGLAMENMGDIDRQSVAGAISTGTHGTGATLQNISSQVVGLRLVKANGAIVDIDRSTDADLLRAAQVSMGTLGVITQVTLQAVPAYHLHERNWQASVAECAEAREDLIANNRHWEFFWDPQTDQCAMKTLNATAAHSLDSPLQGQNIGRSYRVIPSSREFKFNEIEFSVPAAAGWECFLALRHLIQTDFDDVRWPLEYRTLKADDIFLSSANDRDSVTISAHQGAKQPYKAFFSAVENLFREYDGRPHWGKIHTQQASQLEVSMPQFNRFREIRQSMDPQGLFLNPFLKTVFGVD
ncbi:MAG: D-arabinono-1,4-lactone oxidase [SAR86 cluster bacterium]|uniref:FAD-binding protein n=1 Tax=SAR86 cluster bacterium TaxID=2030880 RepID=A0A973AAP7_9GAMM|nr:FAD-binding protein [SAR86 cluster bacterium]